MSQPADPNLLVHRAWDLVIDLANGRDASELTSRARDLMNDTAKLTGNPAPYPEVGS